MRPPISTGSAAARCRIALAVFGACALVLYLPALSDALRSRTTFSAKAAPQVVQVCENTCPGRANDGICDDGRPSLAGGQEQDIAAVHCDLGTDCADCGPWVHTNTKESAAWQPVAEIRAKNFDLYVRKINVPRPFYMGFTDPKKDVDVSLSLHNSGLFELGFTWVWHNVLKEGCIGPNGEQRLVVDVGGNFGYYSLLSAMMGCRVIAWEPVPYFAAFFKYALLRNNLTHLVQLRESIVGDVTGSTLTMVVPQRGIWGTAGVGGMNIDKHINNEGDYDRITKTVERVDDFVREDVLIMKIDVEGFEPTAMRSASKTLSKWRIENIFMEYSPGVAEVNQDWQLLEDNPQMLIGLARAGYTILHLEYSFRDVWPDWEGITPLPKMDVVSEAVLLNDIEDARRLKAGTLGCPLPEEVKHLETGLWECNQIPEAYDPSSFRDTFGHNTNVFATRSMPQWATPGAESVLIPLGNTSFFTDGVFGSFRRKCADLPPAAHVPHRCPCGDKAVCGKLEAAVTRLAAEGKMPPFRTAKPGDLAVSKG